MQFLVLLGGQGLSTGFASGSRTRMSRLAAASFFERESTGTGLAKVEAAAKTIRLVSNQRLKRAVMMLLTESQEGGNDTDELHCSCGGRFVRRR